ncbi:MAG: DUF3467 domain-containing protein [Candidatus Levybacteria bacterium]|nr:DUF3467 domain-containing protein [Candidatus Levybacteria bacterium]
MADIQKAIKIKINVSESVKSGHYSNLFNLTTTSAKEAIIDFVFIHPQDKSGDEQTGTVVSRIIMSTDSAIALKMLLEAQLGKNRKE